MRIVDVEQGTKEWYDLKCGKISSTRLKKVMGSSSDRVDLICQLVSEAGTEQLKHIRTTPEMERGNAEEEFAIKLFEERTGKTVDRVGMCISDEHPWLALSPDGLIKDENGKYTEAVEIKSPDSKTMIFYKLANRVSVTELGIPKGKQTIAGIPKDYIWQVVQYFLVNKDLQKLHFTVYDERFIDEDEKLYIVEVNRENEILQEAIDEALEKLQVFRYDWTRWQEVALPTKF